MSKIILGKTPKTFAPVAVKFPMPDGTEGVINVTFKYRTRQQFGEFLNEVYGIDKPSEEPAPVASDLDQEHDFQKLFGQSCEKNAIHLEKTVDAWDLDIDLSVASLVQLADEIPASVVAIMTAYREACTEGRLGN